MQGCSDDQAGRDRVAPYRVRCGGAPDAGLRAPGRVRILTRGRRALAGLIKLTVSVGVATFPSPGVQGKNQLLQRAQQAAAHATEGGGDRVVYHDGEHFLTTQEQGGSGVWVDE